MLKTIFFIIILVLILIIILTKGYFQPTAKETTTTISTLNESPESSCKTVKDCPDGYECAEGKCWGPE